MDLLAAPGAAERLDVVTDRVRDIVALVFDCAVGDVGVDESLDDLGLDSMMAMEFRVRVNTLFSIDLPVLEILRGVSVNSLAVRVLADVPLPQAVTAPAEDVDKLLEELSEDELLELLAELEADTGA